MECSISTTLLHPLLLMQCSDFSTQPFHFSMQPFFAPKRSICFHTRYKRDRSYIPCWRGLCSEGMQHYSDDVDLSKMKFEWLNVHARFKNYPAVNCAHDALDFFRRTVEGKYNYSLFSPNIFKLVRLVMTHPATTATCERSFRLSGLIKTDIRSTMTDKRFNHLCMLKHHKDSLTEECE